MKNKAVFLDRDGTINIDKEYVHRIEDFEFIDGAIEGIRMLNENDFKVIVISNQSGIGRGYYTEKDVELLHNFINLELAKHNAHINAFYYCAHHPTEAIGKFRIKCNCRKPETGLFKKAIVDFNIDIKKSFLVGDKSIDIEAGNRIGLITILLRAGSHYREAIKYNYIADNILWATKLIIKLSPVFSDKKPRLSASDE